MGRGRTASAVAVLVAVGVTGKAVPADEKLPDPQGADLLQTSQIDGVDTIEGAESTVRYYKKRDGTILAITHIKNRSGTERIWSYAVDTDGKPPFEYILVDVAGDKAFKRFRYGAVVNLTDWINKYHASE